MKGLKRERIKNEIKDGDARKTSQLLREQRLSIIDHFSKHSIS